MSGVLSVQESAALSSAGFSVVSEVMGAVAMRAPATGFFQHPGGGSTYPRGWQGDGGSPPVLTSASVARIPSKVTSLRQGYRTALSRLVDELRAVGADGATGVRVEHTVVEAMDQLVWRFLATGTAVRSTGPVRAARPFTAALSATETAVAIRAGWVPAGYLPCPVMAVRWVEPASRAQERLRAGNSEVTAFTAAVNECRRQAGAAFREAARAVGADAAVMASMDMEVGPAVDLAEVSVMVVGTALKQFRVPDQDTRLSVLSLRDAP